MVLEAFQQGDIIILFALKYFCYSPAQIENITHKYQSIETTTGRQIE